MKQQDDRPADGRAARSGERTASRGSAGAGVRSLRGRSPRAVACRLVRRELVSQKMDIIITTEVLGTRGYRRVGRYADTGCFFFSGSAYGLATDLHTPPLTKT